MKPPVPKLYYSAAEIAAAFGVSKRTVERWRASGCPFREMRAGAGTRPAIRFRVRDVERFIFARDSAAAFAAGAKPKGAAQ